MAGWMFGKPRRRGSVAVCSGHWVTALGSLNPGSKTLLPESGGEMMWLSRVPTVGHSL